MKISTIIFTLILIYNAVLSFVLLNPSWCSDSKQNKMYSTFTNAYLFNLIITVIIIIATATESYVLGTLLGGIILASYGWLFATSYTLYKEDNTPECLKKIGMTTMVFASLFMILIPVAVLLFNESINSSVIKTICGDETGNSCKDKMVTWYENNVIKKIDEITKNLTERAVIKQGAVIKDNKTECTDNKKAAENIIENKKKISTDLNTSIISNTKKLDDNKETLKKGLQSTLSAETINVYTKSIAEDKLKVTKLDTYIEELKKLSEECEEYGKLKELKAKINNPPK